MNKNAKILKSACTTSQEDMALIGKYTRRPLDADEVYTFSLCCAITKLTEILSGLTGRHLKN